MPECSLYFIIGLKCLRCDCWEAWIVSTAVPITTHHNICKFFFQTFIKILHIQEMNQVHICEKWQNTTLDFYFNH